MLKKTETILAITSFIAFILNLFLFPFSIEILILSLGSLTFLYLYFSFALLNNVGLRATIKQKALANTSVYKIFGAILIGGALSIAVFTILFKIMYWPFAKEFTFISIPSLLLVAITTSILFKKNKDFFYKGILIRVWGIGSCLFLLFMIPNETLINFKYRNHPEYLKAFKEWEEDNSDSLKIEKYKEELKKLNE